MQGTNWVKTKDKLPTEGEAVIVIFGGAIQNIIYELVSCNASNEHRWFPIQNRNFNSAPLGTFDYWMYIKDLPLPPMPEGE